MCSQMKTDCAQICVAAECVKMSGKRSPPSSLFPFFFIAPTYALLPERALRVPVVARRRHHRRNFGCRHGAVRGPEEGARGGVPVLLPRGAGADLSVRGRQCAGFELNHRRQVCRGRPETVGVHQAPAKGRESTCQHKRQLRRAADVAKAAEAAEAAEEGERKAAPGCAFSRRHRGGRRRRSAGQGRIRPT